MEIRERQRGVESLHLGANTPFERSGRDRSRPDNETHLVVRTLLDRSVDLRTRPCLQAVAPHATGDTDYRKHRLALASDLEPVANGVSDPEKGTSYGFVDDADSRLAGSVVVCKVTALQQSYAHCPKIAWGDFSVLSQGSLSGGW